MGGAMGALMGGLFFLAVYGAGILAPGNIAWLLQGDPAQHYLGFAFFRNSPWSWPLGAIPGFGGGSSLVYTDSIPLLALPFKILAPWLPPDFQYFGLWMLLCHLLLGLFAARILSRLGVTGVSGAAAILLLLSSPALALRAYGHESLMAHWLLLAAIDAWLAGRNDRLGMFWVLAAWIHAYWVALLAPLACLAWWRAGRRITPLAGFLLALGVSMAAAGYFIARPGQLAAEGYGHYSANLLTFFDPMDWQGFLRHYGRPTAGAGEWSRLLPALGQATAGQYEGFAYLGAGVLGLLFCASLVGVSGWFRRSRGVLFVRIPLARESVRQFDWKPLWVIALACFVYALSAKLTWGERVLWSPRIPDALLPWLGVFRSTGRFVWPLALLLPLTAFSLLAARIPRRVLAPLLLALCLLQAWDLSDKWAEFQHRFAPGGLGRIPYFTGPAWEAAAPCRRLVVLPVQVEGDAWIAPALFAARHRQVLNAAYLARADEAARQQDEAAQWAALSVGHLASGTAYWLRDEAWGRDHGAQLEGLARRLPVRPDEGGGEILISSEHPCLAP